MGCLCTGRCRELGFCPALNDTFPPPSRPVPCPPAVYPAPQPPNGWLCPNCGAGNAPRRTDVPALLPTGHHHLRAAFNAPGA